MHTLDNGPRVYLSVNEAEPRIQTLIAVKTGSKFDPSETGPFTRALKGTHRMGTKDWESEKVLLDEIAATKKKMTQRKSGTHR